MSKLNFLIIVLLGSYCLKATAQPCNTTYLGTKTLYKAPLKKLSAPPAGYTAVFINYVGRHGARHLTKDVNTSYAWQLLKKADSLHMLTPDGEKLQKMVYNLNKVEHSNVKSISAEGREELGDLGRRLYTNNPTVFKLPVKLNVALTKEIRTKQSADAFLAGFKTALKDSTAIKERNDDTNLRFYDLSPAYTNFEEKGAWLVPFDSLKKELHLETLEQRLMGKWFTPAMLQQLTYEQTDKFTGDVFGFENITYSVAGEAKALGYSPADINISSMFTCDELNALGKLDNADGYYKKGPGLNINGIQVAIAAPLLADFITSTDGFIKAQPYNAELRFAHAETVAPFAALLDMQPANKTTANVAGTEKAWKAAEVIPLSANIQWVIYRNTAGRYLVKFLLNENEVKITGLKAAQGCYYEWGAVRRYYLNKLTALGVSLNTDMKRYLSGLK